MYGKAVSEVKRVATLMKKFSEYCGGDYTGLFEYADENTNINLGTHAIDFREFVELETGYYITDNDWINTGVFTWEKLVEHLNKWVKDEKGILASFNVPEDNAKKNILEESLASITAHFLTITDEEFIEDCRKAGLQLKPYNPVKNISIEKYYRCAKGAPSQCDQFHSENGILFMSESDCGKYYYWEDYNSKNELIFFRGEKSWVEDNYRKFNFLDKKEGYSVNVPDKVGEVIGKIEDRWEDKILATLGVPAPLLGEGLYTCTTTKVEDGAEVINSYLKLLDSSENEKIGCVDNQLVKTSDVEEFEKWITSYIQDNNLNMSVQELMCSGTIKGDMIKSKKGLGSSPIKSDDGKSDYYKIELPKWLLDKHSEKGFIMLEDLAEIMFENDFNFTNVFKAQKRMFELTKGQGKAGNDFEYDATKCKYYTDKQVEVFNRNKK
jgi:hypothetical protein